MAKKKDPKSSSVNMLAPPGTLESGESELENWAAKPDSPAYVEAARLYPLIEAAYQDKDDQRHNIEEFWNIYNAIPDENRQYAGNSQCYVPTVRDCINARAKRTLKQLFPARHRHVEALGANEETPYPQLAMLEHYIRKIGLKDIVRSMLVAGDVTGQWNLYIDWTRSYRRITEVVRKNPILESVEGEEVGLTDPREEVEETQDSDLLEEGPELTDFATEDLAVVPATCNSIEKAEAVALKLRMSKAKVRELADEGVFELKEGETVDQLWARLEQGPQGESQEPAKARAHAAGVKVDGTLKYLLAFEATAKLPFVEDGVTVERLAYIYYAGTNEILGIVKAPQWGGKRPILSAPVERIAGSFFGNSKIEPIKFLQWNLNDYWNMGQDSAMYSLLPIVMTDPLKNPVYSSMVIGLSAVWLTSPNDTKPLSFPQLYKESMEMCAAIKAQIWESMDVNEMMLGRTPPGRKNNAMVGAMQAEQMTTIMDHAERFEEVILTPLAERMAQYDQQWRTRALTVVTKGEIGVKAKLTEVEPQAFGERFEYTWVGTSVVQGQQLMQMQIAFMNVLRGVPPQQLNGRRVDVTPILEKQVEALFGAEVAPLILVDERNMFTVPPEVENEMMHNGLPADVHEADDDQAHIINHMSAARLTTDPGGRMRAHIAKHTMSMQAKLQKQMAMAQGTPGAPGPSEGVRGMAGSPRVGAQPDPAGRPGMQMPPGMPHPDAAGPGRG